MAFNFGDAQGDASAKPFLFKPGISYGDIKGDEKRPMSFRILPAFPEHEGSLQESDALAYVPAVSLVGGAPVVADWAFAMLISRCYVKGGRSILSRKMVGDDNDPLTRVVDFCSKAAGWKYVVTETGKWGEPNRIPAKIAVPKKEFLMNVLTLDDEKPGVKVGIIKSIMMMYDLCSTKQGKEGYALQQREVSDEEYRANPNSVWAYGDITDPNGAPVFKALKGLSNDNRMVNMVKPSLSIDPASGRQRLDRMALTAEQMAARVDLAHPETYLNIPTAEEQVEQIVGNLGGRNAEGIHEYDMLRNVLPDYAELIPAVPPAPGAVNQVQGVSFEKRVVQAGFERDYSRPPRTFGDGLPDVDETKPVYEERVGAALDPAAQAVGQSATAPVRRFQPQVQASAAPKTFTPTAPKAVQTFAPPATPAAPAAPTAPTTPAFVPKAASVPPTAPVQTSPAAVAGVPGEEFNDQDWVSKYTGATTDPAKAPF